MHVYCDFDGTITREDATDFVLSRLAAPEWETIEAEWKAGRIGSAECMRRQIPLIEADRATLNATLDAIPVDPYFAEFVGFCEDAGMEVKVVSDGVDYFIHRILARMGLSHLPVLANHLVMTGKGGYQLSSPYALAGCQSASGVCKCALVDTGREPRVYVGDGRSDFCVSEKPEIVFAKASLATYCAHNAIPFIAYEDFSDVQMALGRLLPVAAARMAQFA